MTDIRELLKTSYTAYHAVKNAEELLRAAGFVKIGRGEDCLLYTSDAADE